MINTSIITELLNLNKGKFNLLRINSYYIDKINNLKLLEEVDDLIKELKISKSMLNKNLKLIEANGMTDDAIFNINYEEDRICIAQQHKKSIKEESISVVYLIHNIETNKLKIGTTYYINKRLSTIKSSIGCDLVLLHSIKGDASLEKELHKKFSEFRDIGEWFIYHESIIDFFNNYK
jgi:hypothetical protein